jgi:raffinose/stachyose/melibiose transport system permease protein
MSEFASSTPAPASRLRRLPKSPSLGATGFLVVFLAPSLVLFTTLVILPMIQAGWYSFFDWNGYGVPENFVGLRNFQQLFGSSVFLTALRNNGLIIAVSVVLQIPLALWLATLVSRRFAGAVFFRAVFFLPFVLADVAAGIIWSFIYDGNYGLVASLGHALGFDPPFLLADKQWAIYAVLVVIIWKYFGFHMMLFIAGLQGISPDYHEAAEIDGASRRQRFLHITLPLLKPTIALSVFFSVLGALQTFDVIMPLTQGGPANSTQSMVSFLYLFGISRMKIGFGSAVGVVLFLMCATFAFAYKKMVRKDE